jgi:hypothetical protein
VIGLRGAAVLDVLDDQGCCGDPADCPRADADVVQGFEGGLEQGIPAFADRPDGVVGSVELLLDERAGGPAGFLNATVMVPCSPL